MEVESTLIKLINGLLTPTSGKVLIDGMAPCTRTKEIVSYLPERTYLNDWMKVREIIAYFDDFYANFVKERALEMLERLGISPDARLRTLSKGSREKYSSSLS